MSLARGQEPSAVLLLEGRAGSPEQLWARLADSAAAAGVTRVSELSAFEALGGVHVFRAVRPAARSFSSTLGVGETAAAARVGALAGALERAEAESFRGPLWRAPLGASWPGLPQRALLWAAAEELLLGARCWMPEALVHADDTSPERELGLSPSRVGLAAGADVEEARLFALFEVLERAAPARRELEVPLGCSPRLDRVRASCRVEVMDASLCGVPVVRVTIHAEGEHRGAAARATPEAALEAALAEALGALALDRAGGPFDPEPRGWPPETASGAPVSLAALPRLPEPSLAALLARLRDAGLTRVVALTLTPPDAALAVVRAALPELTSEVPR